MRYYVTAPRAYTARRKAHLCSLCQHSIAIGQQYRSWRYFHRDNDGPADVTVHPDCEQLWVSWADPADYDAPWAEDEIGSLLVRHYGSKQEIDDLCAAAADPHTAEIWRQIWRESQGR